MLIIFPQSGSGSQKRRAQKALAKDSLGLGASDPGKSGGGSAPLTAAGTADPGASAGANDPGAGLLCGAAGAQPAPGGPALPGGGAPPVGGGNHPGPLGDGHGGGGPGGAGGNGLPPDPQAQPDAAGTVLEKISTALKENLSVIVYFRTSHARTVQRV